MTPAEREERKRETARVLRKLREEVPGWAGTLAGLIDRGTQGQPALYLALMAGASIALIAKGRGHLFFMEVSALGAETVQGLIDDILSVVERA